MVLAPLSRGSLLTSLDPMEPVRVVVAEDGDLLRAGLLTLLRASAQIDVVGVATDMPSLMAAVEESRPDVLLTDIRMPPTWTDEGIRAAVELRLSRPQLGVVVLTQYTDVEYALDLIGAGSEGRGYLLKERVADIATLVTAIRTVANGGSVIDEQVVSQLMAASARRASPLDRLTPREREVLALVARGMTNSAIGAELFVTERAVEKHVSSILSKLDLASGVSVHRRVAATLVFLSEAGVGASLPPRD